MTTDDKFEQFFIEHPEQRSSLEPSANSYGYPLTPSGMYVYWQWQRKTRRKDADLADSLCKFLIVKFGERVKNGAVTSWEMA